MSLRALGSQGYREMPLGGPRVRTDVVEVFVFRRPVDHDGPAEFLQLFRASEPLARTWHPILGHVEPGETAVDTAVRELREEIGLAVDSAGFLGLWALEQVHPYYIAQIDAIVMGPRFAARVVADWEPRLNDEHSAHRWVTAAGSFMWPGQKRAIAEILREIVDARSLTREALRVRVE
jgi:8-oxo-dGTP pyrophosphatase MutT (NUDIX family)